MLFQVLQNRVPVMSTDYVECIYDKGTLKQMAVAGYKFRLNGKSATVSDIVAYVEAHKNGKEI